jgi:transcription elongation GreA/GreB family factor
VSESGTLEVGHVVEIGSTVTVQDGLLREVWTIVHAGEADPFDRRISQDCALAQALLGRRVGDGVRVRGSRRGWDVEILDVEPSAG